MSTAFVSPLSVMVLCSGCDLFLSLQMLCVYRKLIVSPTWSVIHGSLLLDLVLFFLLVPVVPAAALSFIDLFCG